MDILDALNKEIKNCKIDISVTDEEMMDNILRFVKLLKKEKLQSEVCINNVLFKTTGYMWAEFKTVNYKKCIWIYSKDFINNRRTDNGVFIPIDYIRKFVFKIGPNAQNWEDL